MKATLLGLVQKSSGINVVVKPSRTLPRYLCMLVHREKAIELVLEVFNYNILIAPTKLNSLKLA